MLDARLAPVGTKTVDALFRLGAVRGIDARISARDARFQRFVASLPI